jgi:WXXGXW repeat (2 copies)
MESNMKLMELASPIRNSSLALFVAVSAVAMPAFAQVNLNIRVAPPAQVVEVMPATPRGYVWVPGHWAWQNDRYVWIRGRNVVQRPGYMWAPDRWEQRGETYYRNPGRWEPDNNYRPHKEKKAKKPKKQEHGNNGRGNDR